MFSIIIKYVFLFLTPLSVVSGVTSAYFSHSKVFYDSRDDFHFLESYGRLASRSWEPEQVNRIEALLNQQPRLSKNKKYFHKIPGIARQIYRVSLRYQIDPFLILAIIAAESGFKVNAVSEKGALGLMQVLPSTAEALMKELGVWKEDDQLNFKVRVLDPQLNILLGVYYLSQLRERFSKELPYVYLAAYHQGPAKMTQALKISKNKSFIGVSDQYYRVIRRNMSGMHYSI